MEEHFLKLKRYIMKSSHGICSIRTGRNRESKNLKNVEHVESMRFHYIVMMVMAKKNGLFSLVFF